MFCNSCQTEANKNEFKQPNCGTVETRLASDLYEFKDPNGRSPISYIIFLNKLKLSINTAVEEATKLNITIPIEHFDIIKTDKKSKGRPKKINSNVETKAVDLFSKLSDDTEFDIIEDDEEEKSEPLEKEIKEVKVVKAKLTDEEKEIKKAQLEEERAKKKAEREQKLAQEKAEKAAEKELKRQTEMAEKAAEKAKQEQVKECNNFEAPQQKEEPKATKVTVSKIQICGKIYLKSSANILYDPDTKEEIGIYDPETKTIKDLPDDDDEEEEDSYDTDEDN